MKRKNNSGQAIIVVLLIIVVALTIGLSITMRTVKDIKMSTRTEESQRAFSAAEAGLEAALLSGGGVSNQSFGTGGNLEYTATVANVGGGRIFVFPDKIERDDTQQIWFVAHDTNGEVETRCPPPSSGPCYNGDKIEIYWGNNGSTSIEPALEATLIYYDKNNKTYKLKKYAYDPNSRGNNFSSVADLAGNYILNYDSKDYNFQYRIADPSPLDFGLPGNNQAIALRLRLLYNDEAHILGVKIPATVNQNYVLAYQGEEYKSVGMAKTAGEGETETRTISFIKSYPTLPGIFDFALFSNTSLEK